MGARWTAICAWSLLGCDATVVDLGQSVPDACRPTPVTLATDVNRLDRVGAAGDVVFVSYEADSARNLLLLDSQGPVRTSSISGSLGAIAASAAALDGAWYVAFQHHQRTGSWTVYASGLDLDAGLSVSEAAPVNPPDVPSFHPLIQAGTDELQVFYRASARLEVAVGTLQAGFTAAQSIDAPSPVNLLKTLAVDATGRTWVAGRGAAGVLFEVGRNPSASGALRVGQGPWLTPDGDGVLVSSQLSDGPVVVDRYTSVETPPTRWVEEVVPSGEMATVLTRAPDGSVWLGWQDLERGTVSAREVGASGEVGPILELETSATSTAAQPSLEAASTAEAGWIVWYHPRDREIRGARMGCQ
ncbi:MAG: hypothetical protein AAFU79_19895 [Myxococcota bacterium]